MTKYSNSSGTSWGGNGINIGVSSCVSSTKPTANNFIDITANVITCNTTSSSITVSSSNYAVILLLCVQ